MKTAVNHIENLFTTFTYRPEAANRSGYRTTSLILMFFTFSGIGWLWEVGLHIVQDGMFFNRGFLAGPWLPIYGTGGILILVVLKKWHGRPLVTFGLTMLLCGTVEYVTGFFLETLFHVRWWNYSDMILQLHGRVCLEGLLIFGAGGLFIIYVAAPRLDRCFCRLTSQQRLMLCTILIILISMDLVRSFISPNMGFGITSL